MQQLGEIARVEAIVFLSLLLSLVAYRMLTGRVRLKGLLQDKRSGQLFSAARLQGLLFTVGFAALILGGMGAALEDPATPLKLAGVDPQMAALLGGSQMIYLLNKARPGGAGLNLMNRDG